MVFAASLRQLFAAAGSPAVTLVAREVGVSAGTVSHWRTGRHLPADFSVIEPLLVVLIDQARRNQVMGGSDVDAAAAAAVIADSRAVTPAAGGGVLSVRQFEGLFAAAVGGEVVVPALDQIAASAEVWAARAGGVLVGQARRVLLDCVEVTSAGYLTPRVSWIGSDPDRDAPAAMVVGALIDVGILTPINTDEDTGEDEGGTSGGGVVGGVVLVDVQVVNLWPRLGRWVSGAWTDLQARAGLEHDARRWQAAGQPRELLYDHQRLTLASAALVALNQPAPPPAQPGAAAAVEAGAGFRFGAATVGDVPVAARSFWTLSQRWAVQRLRVDQITMALLITLAVMVLGLGFTLAALT
ncbi:hypothetical protein TPB0596_10220 [Tsukamurella pulmonis]|uniref:hypothetical protein n=1 Tax=Tsukamurella pulmonis TaxID=47312 RepID=UPI001EE02DE3|nr:hypothetical protein [Tsukamurella pulmonis]BDD81259.1 hypothetical protein TPB0596_10220 [Tsukamurella pulmonis]